MSNQEKINKLISALLDLVLSDLERGYINSDRISALCAILSAAQPVQPVVQLKIKKSFNQNSDCFKI